MLDQATKAQQGESIKSSYIELWQAVYELSYAEYNSDDSKMLTWNEVASMIYNNPKEFCAVAEMNTDSGENLKGANAVIRLLDDIASKCSEIDNPFISTESLTTAIAETVGKVKSVQGSSGN